MEKKEDDEEEEDEKGRSGKECRGSLALMGCAPVARGSDWNCGGPWL